MELIGLYLVAAGLLVVAGVAKALRPDDTARALAALARPRRRDGHLVPLRVARGVVRTGALAEAALGIAALVLPRPLAAARSPPAGASGAPTPRRRPSTWSST